MFLEFFAISMLERVGKNSQLESRLELLMPAPPSYKIVLTNLWVSS